MTSQSTIRVEFRDASGKLLYDADLPTPPHDGDLIQFPSGNWYRAEGNPIWRIGERVDQHRITVTVVKQGV